MLGSWNITVDGREHFVFVERGENEKDIVRVNGRVAAKPLGPDDAERGISVGGVPYMLQRTGPDSYELIQDEWSAADARSRDTANAVLAHTQETPLAMVKSSALRTIPLLGWAAIVAFVAVMMVYATGDSYEGLAEKRVDEILREMHTGEYMKMQFAVTVWAKNRRVLESQEMSWAADHFDNWRREKGLYNKAFTRWEVLDSEEVEGADNPTAIVTFTIEDQRYKVRVPKDRPITWEN